MSSPVRSRDFGCTVFCFGVPLFGVRFFVGFFTLHPYALDARCAWGVCWKQLKKSGNLENQTPGDSTHNKEWTNHPKRPDNDAGWEPEHPKK